MPYVVRYELDRGSSVLVEVDDDDFGVERVARAPTGSSSPVADK
jgi:hypothetical protein